MDNNRPTENIQPTSRPRKDSLTPEMRRSVQQGFPTRRDAGNAMPPVANRRPKDDSTIPGYMRRGEAPLRPKPQPGSPVKHSNTVTQTRSPEANRAIASGIPTRTARRPAEPSAPAEAPRPAVDSAENTITIDRAALTRLAEKNNQAADDAVTTVIERPVKTAPAPEAASAKEASEENNSRFAALLAGIRTNTGKFPKVVIPALCSVFAVLLLCILLPLTLSAKQNYSPDFDMTAALSENVHTLETLTDEQIRGIPVGEDSEIQPLARKFLVTIDFFDKESISVSTSAITLASLLEKVGYTPRESDLFPCGMETELTEETVLTVDTILYQTVTETVTIPYESEVVNVQTIPRGTKEVSQEGKNGSKTLTYSVELINGQETGRTLVSEVVDVEPVKEIAQLGVGGTFTGNDGKTYSYSYYRIVNATYYNLEGPTYLGYNADESVIAVDPRYIPLGTKVYVKNDKYDFGVRIAADTGSMIIGWEVDIWIGANNPQLPAFAHTGYHYDMRVYYLD